jgi:hypothetical protein
MNKVLLVGGVVIAAALLTITARGFAPELWRYLKIRRMSAA